MIPPSSIPLPKQWPNQAKTAFLCAVALAHQAMVWSVSWCINSRIGRVRLIGENEQLKAEVAMLKEELRIKNARLDRIPAASRPHYPPTERHAILALKAMRGWNNTQAAKAFHLCDATVASWLARIEETGSGALVQTQVPVNKFPDFVGQLVQQLKATCPTMGKVRISQMLAKAGLRLSPSTAKRMLTRRYSNSLDTNPSPTRPVDSNAINTKESGSSSNTHDKPARVVTAKYPQHVWHIDLTIVPTALGLWIPWLPFAIGQHWPFCYWVVVVIDHFSRKCLMAHASRSQPSTDDVTTVLDTAIAIAGKAPKYIVSDQGSQFRDDYELWCQATGIKSRFGAIGQHGSIAIVERFILSLKNECTRTMLVPLSLAPFQNELLRYVTWFNEHRPHQSLAGRTPNEIYDGTRLARDASRFETRTEPRKGKNHAVERVTKLRLVVSQLDGRPYLPIVKLERAA